MFGYVPSKPDNRDYVFSMFDKAAEQFPDEYIYSHQPPIYDQGQYPMCVAFGLASIKEAQETAERGKDVRYSPGFIYSNRESTHEGMEPREALKHLVDEGVCSYDAMPIRGQYYICKSYLGQYREQLLEMAKPQRIMSYVRLHTPEEMMSALMKWGPIGIGIKVRRSFQYVSRNGIIPPVKESEPVAGMHWIDCFGWKTIRGKKHLVVFNSWGTNWGDKGKCYLPIDYADIVEVWALTDARVIKMDTETVINKDNRTLIPLRFFSEALGAKVIWQEEEGKVTVQIPPRKEPMILETVIGSDEIKIGKGD